MLTCSHIPGETKKQHRLVDSHFFRSGLLLSIIVAFTACTSSNTGLGTLEKSANSAEVQAPDGNPLPENAGGAGANPTDPHSANPNQQSSNTPLPSGHLGDRPNKVPLPTPLPLQQQQQANAQQPAESGNKQIASQAAPQSEANARNLENPQATQTATTEEQKPKKTALFSFGRKKEELAQPMNAPQSSDITPAHTPPTDKGASPSATSTVAPLQNTIVPPQKPASVANDQTSTEARTESSDSTSPAPEHDATSQKKGGLMRLFGHSDNRKENKPVDNGTKTALVPLPKKDPHEYNDVLPGVRPNGGIVIKHRTSLYDDTDIDANEIDSPSLYTLASVSMYGRSLPNGLKVARKDVEVSCLRPQLVAILKTIERRFNKPVIITSGYRSPAYNQKVNGAKRSMHMSCAAADIQVPDTNKWDVAKFVRALPNRGGVGTYCHQSIHVDVGPKRDWNWSCSAKN